ncbi:MAG: PP2C family protein-serine/threonine phosphatase [bacterium]|nr:PP2C family protein-serine/threonine phosphatase [bacterium]
MDSILIFGSVDEKIPKALNKMGYELHMNVAEPELIKYIETKFIDLLIVDSRGIAKPTSICSQIRDGSTTKRLPILFIAHQEKFLEELKELKLDRVELADQQTTLGGIISKAATMLRLRKMVGASKDNTASLSEVNAHLRDLTEKHKRELEDAKKIQQNLLPKNLPKGENFEIESCYIPLEDLGGDWYYVHEVADGKIGMMIADVTGHGLPAAFIGSMTKLAMVATKKEMPADLLDGMNKLMTPQMPQGRFVTMAAALYDPKSGRLDFSRAGHPPLFVLSRKTNTVKEYLAGGFAIGFLEEGDYGSESFVLEKGDIAVLLTDGITEAQNRKLEQFGHSRVAAALLKSKPEDSANDILKSLINNFLEYIQGRILKDDVTVLVLKRTI